MNQIKILANNIEFEVLIEGESDKLILLLHGFPDDAKSYTHLMQNLSAAGYMCAAPYMRGYYPTSVPENVKSSQFATIQIADLAEDCAELAKILKKKFNIKQVFLVGHDWGAIAAYGAVNFQPEIYSKAAMMSVPPGGTFLRNLIMNPGQFARSWYILFFQLPILPENTIENTHGEFIRSLWHSWSSNSEKFSDRISEVITTLSQPFALRAALAYYRGLLRPPLNEWARWNQSRELFLSNVKVPSLVMTGSDDNCIAKSMFESCELDLESSGGKFKEIAHAGHFLPLEAPDAIAKELISFFS